MSTASIPEGAAPSSGDCARPGTTGSVGAAPEILPWECLKKEPPGTEQCPAHHCEQFPTASFKMLKELWAPSVPAEPDPPPWTQQVQAEPSLVLNTLQ